MRSLGRRDRHASGLTKGLHVALAASVLVAVDVAKPLVVDDAAYRADPSDPYGFEIHWNDDDPQPAFQVLAPPVLPYWLAGSMAPRARAGPSTARWGRGRLAARRSMR